MAFPLINPIFQFLDNSGDVLSGGLLYTYAPGTTTPKTTYSDENLSVPNANPIVLDSAGRCTIFLTDGEEYKFVLQTSAGVTVRTVDEVKSPSAMTQANIGAALYPRTAAEIAAGVTPVRFEIVNDWSGVVVPDRFVTNTTPGTTDMTTAIQQALNVAANSSSHARCVQLLGDTYLTGNLDWPANNMSMKGVGSAFSYNTSAAPKTVLQAKSATTIVLDLVQTGVAEDRTGNHISDLEINGNSIATVGIDVAGSNVIERVRVRGCSTAGILLDNWTNGTHLLHCGANQNSGWGLRVQGVNTTQFSADGSNFSLNTTGGVDLQAGVIGTFNHCTMESNTGPGVRLLRASAHTNNFGWFTFNNCWIEDNASASPFYVLVFDSESSGDTSKDVEYIHFYKCNITAGSATRKYANIAYAKNVTFERCKFSGSTETTAITTTSRSRRVAIIECGLSILSGGLTAAQLDSAVANGSNCWWHDPGTKRVVGAGSPAASFTNSWANFGNNYVPAAYWFDRNGDVCLEGNVQSGTPPSSVFTLPAGYRPGTDRQHTFAVDANGAHGQLYVNVDGTVVVQVGSATKTSMDGVRFSTG